MLTITSSIFSAMSGHWRHVAQIGTLFFCNRGAESQGLYSENKRRLDKVSDARACTV